MGLVGWGEKEVCVAVVADSRLAPQHKTPVGVSDLESAGPFSGILSPQR